MVNSLADLPVDLTDPTVTLRDAIHAANTDAPVAPGGPAGSGTDIITFDPALFTGGPQTLYLSINGVGATGNGGASALAVASTMTIQAEPRLLTIDAGAARRHFRVSSPNGDLTLDGIELTHGHAMATSATTWGGAIANFGVLTVRRSTFTDNIGGFGGAIASFSGGTTRILDSTFVGNEADESLGGAVSNSGSLFVVDSTFTGNSAYDDGGAIANASGTAILRNLTITGNRGEGGGGIYGNQTVRVYNSIVAGNTSTSGSHDIRNTPSTARNNIVGVAGNSGLVDGVDGNQVGVDVATVLDPTLQDNGGPTDTLALLVGGPAIDAGESAEALDPDGSLLLHDQRGPGFPRISGLTVDVGAYEHVFTADEQAELINTVVWDLYDAGVLSKGQRESLLLDLKGNRGDQGKVGAFLKKLEPLRKKGQLSQQQYDLLARLGWSLLDSLANAA